MPTVTIDGKEYESESLSEDVKAQLQSLQACDVRIAEAQQTLAILQTARNAYGAALKELVAEEEDE